MTDEFATLIKDPLARNLAVEKISALTLIKAISQTESGPIYGVLVKALNEAMIEENTLSVHELAFHTDDWIKNKFRHTLGRPGRIESINLALHRLIPNP